LDPDGIGQGREQVGHEEQVTTTPIPAVIHVGAATAQIAGR
jgi:hypothetical protein